MLLGVTGNTVGSDPTVLGSNPREAAQWEMGYQRSISEPPSCLCRPSGEPLDLGSGACRFDSCHKYELVVHTLNYPANSQPLALKARDNKVPWSKGYDLRLRT